MSGSSISRRKFIRQSSAAVAAISATSFLPACNTKQYMKNDKGMPLRNFGKTGIQISILGYGCGSQFMIMPNGEWESSFQHAFEAGINFFDTSCNYGENEPVPSEARLGQIIPAIRKDIILQTKLAERDYDKALKQFERSLNRLKTDYVDLLMIHAVMGKDNLAEIEKGVYRAIRGLKEQKVVRSIGFSCHDDANRAKELIENLEIDHVQLAMNATKYGELAEIALPKAVEKGLGVVSMKVMRDIVTKGYAPGELLAYNWQLPGVSTNVVAHNGLAPLAENIAIAKDYGKDKLTLANPEKLESQLAQYANSESLVWAGPGYYDGMV